jgi:hypothetical protein
MKIAILLSGIHYKENYLGTIVKTPHTVDYRKYFKNYKEKIYDYFEKIATIDIYISTNDSIHLIDLLNDYKPIKYCISEDDMVSKRIKGLELIPNYYDYIIMTRFDICFKKDFSNLHLNKMNIVSELEHKNVCDDNFYFFPIKYLEPFLEMIKKKYNPENHNTPGLFHYLKNDIEKNMDFYYFCNEPGKNVANLSFFKLRYF